jgi:phosphofructokinase-like protein
MVQKRIGILTSGGDCAGLNAVIRAVVHRAVGTYGWEVLGICRATQGLMHDPPKAIPLTIDERLDALLTQGGTMLGTTNKGDPFAFPMPDGTVRDRAADIIKGYNTLGLDAIIGIGGDGSLAILRKLAQQGMNLVGIPKTIDNDVGVTERSIGFDTAVNIATEALDRLHFTAASHNRVMILEVMGRDAGHIALNAGIAGGAHIILIPEIPYKIENIVQKIRERQAQGQHFCLVIVSEAICTEGDVPQCRPDELGKMLGDQIAQETSAETRVTVLGHIQRGGIPSPLDRLLGSAFGVAAVDLIAEGKFDHLVTWQNRQVVSVPIEEAIREYRAIDPDDALVKTARGLGICLGD